MTVFQFIYTHLELYHYHPNKNHELRNSSTSAVSLAIPVAVVVLWRSGSTHRRSGPWSCEIAARSLGDGTHAAEAGGPCFWVLVVINWYITSSTQKYNLVINWYYPDFIITNW